MIDLEEIKKYLPQYLSDEKEKGLFEELKQFPNNIDSRIYTDSLKSSQICYQGDGINNLLIVNLPNTDVRPAPGVILSNTCDIATENDRLMPMRVAYAPIFQLQKYEDALIREHVETGRKSIAAIKGHIGNIQKQLISHIFYLPKHDSLQNDSIVFFDRISNCPAESLESNGFTDNRMFTLSNYGFYLFLFKISVHFTRIRESVDRSLSTVVN
ncbi:MAG: hypothetical protein ACI8ZB_002674 [Desulforhopalus sp.]|jgi:hypothetical protein